MLRSWGVKSGGWWCYETRRKAGDNQNGLRSPQAIAPDVCSAGADHARLYCFGDQRRLAKEGGGLVMGYASRARGTYEERKANPEMQEVKRWGMGEVYR